MQRLAKSTGKRDPRLMLQCPAPMRSIWRAFTQMRRPGGGMGPQPISNMEIDAWQRINGVRLTPWELDCIYMLDGVAMEAMRKKQ